MKIRTFFAILFGFFGLGIVGYGLFHNHELLNAPFRLHATRTVPLFTIVVAAFFLGFFLAGILGIARELNLLVSRRRHKREEKRMNALEERYFEGVQAVAQGREEDALRNFGRILDKDPTHFNALLKIGEVLVAMGRYAEGTEHHTKARQLRPDDTRPLYALSTDYEAQGDLDKAKAALRKIVEIKPRAALSAYRRLRQIYSHEGDWARALEVHHRIERLAEKGAPSDPREAANGNGIRYQLGMKHLEETKTKVALGLFQRLIKDAPQFIPAYIRVGEILREMDNDIEAAAVWNRGYDQTGSPIFLTVLEEHFLDREQPIEAIESLKACVARATNDTLPRFFLGKLFFRLEMLDDALQTLKSLEGRTAYAPTLHYLIGRIHERRGNYRGSSEQFRKVIKELELVKLEYRCQSCQIRLSEWSDRCPKCEAWNAIEIDFREDMSLQELGISRAPIYSQLT